jgi:hypothetical protein
MRAQQLRLVLPTASVMPGRPAWIAQLVPDPVTDFGVAAHQEKP